MRACIRWAVVQLLGNRSWQARFIEDWRLRPRRRVLVDTELLLDTHRSITRLHRFGTQVTHGYSAVYRASWEDKGGVQS